MARKSPEGEQGRKTGGSRARRRPMPGIERKEEPREGEKPTPEQRREEMETIIKEVLERVLPEKIREVLEASQREKELAKDLPEKEKKAQKAKDARIKKDFTGAIKTFVAQNEELLKENPELIKALDKVLESLEQARLKEEERARQVEIRLSKEQVEEINKIKALLEANQEMKKGLFDQKKEIGKKSEEVYKKMDELIKSTPELAKLYKKWGDLLMKGKEDEAKRFFDEAEKDSRMRVLNDEDEDLKKEWGRVNKELGDLDKNDKELRDKLGKLLAGGEIEKILPPTPPSKKKAPPAERKTAEPREYEVEELGEEEIEPSPTVEDRELIAGQLENLAVQQELANLYLERAGDWRTPLERELPPLMPGEKELPPPVPQVEELPPLTPEEGELPPLMPGEEDLPPSLLQIRAKEAARTKRLEEGVIFPQGPVEELPEEEGVVFEVTDTSDGGQTIEFTPPPIDEGLFLISLREEYEAEAARAKIRQKKPKRPEPVVLEGEEVSDEDELPPPMPRALEELPPPIPIREIQLRRDILRLIVRNLEGHLGRYGEALDQGEKGQEKAAAEYKILYGHFSDPKNPPHEEELKLLRRELQQDLNKVFRRGILILLEKARDKKAWEPIRGLVKKSEDADELALCLDVLYKLNPREFRLKAKDIYQDSSDKLKPIVMRQYGFYVKQDKEMARILWELKEEEEKIVSSGKSGRKEDEERRLREEGVEFAELNSEIDDRLKEGMEILKER